MPLYFCLFFSSSQLKHRNYSYFMNLRMTNLNRAMQQFMVMDYGLFENASFLDDVGNWDRSLQSNNRGLEGRITESLRWEELLSRSCCLAAYLIPVSPWIALVGLVFITVFYLVQKNITIYQHNRRKNCKGPAQNRPLHLRVLRLPIWKGHAPVSDGGAFPADIPTSPCCLRKALQGFHQTGASAVLPGIRCPGTY